MTRHPLLETDRARRDVGIKPQPGAAPRLRHNTCARRWGIRVTRHMLLLTGVVLFMGPFYWMIVSSVKAAGEVFARPVIWWPHRLLWSNFADVLHYPGFPFLRFLGNSIFYTASVTIGTVLSCTVVGYGFARLRFPGRDLLFALTVATLMIPDIVTLIPTYVLFKYVGLLGSYGPLVIPRFTGHGFFIFLMRQFFLGLPWELSEAAKADGAGEWRIFWHIMLPLVQSALIVVAVFSVVYTWHDFFGPLVYLSDPSQYPLALGLFAFQSEHTTDWTHLMAAATLTTLPLLALFFAAQRYIVQGITMTGIRG
jgi:multiple sugar transport system permease protein